VTADQPMDLRLLQCELGRAPGYPGIFSFNVQDLPTSCETPDGGEKLRHPESLSVFSKPNLPPES
jgi:hypothetical protein